jgi:DegV family protein with EDD domain
MIKIIVDGSADMPVGWAEKFQFDILPMPIQIGGATYYQGEDITPTMFYEILSKQSEQSHPQTAAPSPSRIAAFIERVTELGDTVLSINVSGKMSSTVTMVEHAAQQLRDKVRVITFDSGAGSAVLALMAREARLKEAAGASLEEILDVLKRIRDQVLVVLTLDNLEFAKRSGRVSALKAAVTSLLKIKPIISLQQGSLEMSGVVRTRNKALEQLVSRVKTRFGSQPIRVAVVHSQDPETAEQLKVMLGKKVTAVETVFTELSISVAANLGPGTVGIVAIPEKV